MKISLKAARVNAGFSQDQLAKQIGVSKSTISRWELNILEIPDEMLCKICDSCHVKKKDIKFNGKEVMR